MNTYTYYYWTWRNTGGAMYTVEAWDSGESQNNIVVLGFEAGKIQ
jgi:hypothetical protein